MISDFLATVEAVHPDGLTLKFDGIEQPSEKHYKRNLSATFQPGQRVKVTRVSGTLIVEYPIG